MSDVELLRVESAVALLVVATVFALTFFQFASARRPFSNHVSGILLLILLVAGSDMWVSAHLSALNTTGFAEFLVHLRRYLIIMAALGTIHLYHRVTR